jgi:vacuolar-type H+-ATPase subunit H
MLRNIIDEIKLAEQNAYEIRKGAESDAQSSVDAAKNEAKKIYNDAIKSTETECAVKISEAKRIAEARIDESRRMAYENACAMTEIAKEKEDAAVKIIIDGVLKV